MHLAENAINASITGRSVPLQTVCPTETYMRSSSPDTHRGAPFRGAVNRIIFNNGQINTGSVRVASRGLTGDFHQGLCLTDLSIIYSKLCSV